MLRKTVKMSNVGVGWTTVTDTCQSRHEINTSRESDDEWENTITVGNDDAEQLKFTRKTRSSRRRDVSKIMNALTFLYQNIRVRSPLFC